MKSIFRKIRGKKKDDEERSAWKLNNAQGYPQPVSALQPNGQPAPQSIPQNQNFGSLPTQDQNRNVYQPSAPSGSNTLRATVPSPHDEIGRLLAQPASNSTDHLRNLVQIEPLALCPVCCNFDASQAPPDGDSHQRSWAKAEYNIPDETPVGKITVEKSEQLLEAAKGGCLYCSTVVTALGAVHPGWETDKTFVHIFVAAGLPVVVRLQFGTTSTVPIGREGMLEFGVELPEGQDMHFVITVGDPSKPPIEVEIYRPVIPDNQLTVGDVVLAPLVQNVGFAEEIPGHTRDQRCLNFIKEKVGTCVKQHKCGKDGALPLLPERVIWIEANNGSRIQLLEPKNIRAPYVALSYCWGPVDPYIYLTNSHTLNARKAGIELNDLPPLFQDVVDTARALGIEYIWIDRLCIIQGDDEDFRSQAPKMGDIYGNATLTIAAASATTENDLILVPRDTKWLSFDLNMDVNPIGSLKLRFRRLSHALGKEDSGGDYGKISTRAWIWQERLLAARTVFFTPTALRFECHCHSLWEGFDKGRTGRSWSSQLDNMTFLAWTNLVEEYMRRDITRPYDRLPAMDAVMKRIEKRTGWSPFWGLWQNALVESLSWEAKESKRLGEHGCRMNPGHYAPTWSWASVDGPISYISARPLSLMEEDDGMQWDLECRSLNGASGLIRVAGHMILLELHVTVVRNELHENNSTEEEKFRYSYEVRSPNDQSGFPVKPDVPLKPWNGNINGQYVSTVVRVPYGETPPEQSWTTYCACLLVRKWKMRSLVLFLGRSLREPGAWERIGMVDGISPAVFTMSRRHIVDIA